MLLKEHHDGEGEYWNFTYGYCAYDFIRHIEAVVFPFLNQKLDFHTEIDQHKVIFSSVEKIIAEYGAITVEKDDDPCSL